MGTIVKRTLTFAAVGAALALAAPYIAMTFGVVEATGYAAAAEMLGHSANPAWLGPFFGAFGALDAVAAPIFDKLFADGSKTDSAVSVSGKDAPGQGKGLEINNVQLQPIVKVAADVDVDAKANLVGGTENVVDNKAKLFTQLVDAARAENPTAVLTK